MIRATELLALVLLACPSGLSARQATLLPIRDTTLANGLRVLVAEDHRIPVFTATLAVRAGADAQPNQARGIAHVFEHLLFRSFGRDPSDFAQEVAKLRGTYNGTTGVDVVTYYVVAPAEGVQESVKLLAGLIKDVRVDEDDLREELPVILDEMARADDQPVVALKRRMAPRIWGPEWHRHDVLGDSASLADLTLENVEDHLARFYLPTNSALIVTGDADAESVFQEAAKRFGGWRTPAGATVPSRLTPAATGVATTSVVLLAADVPDATINVTLPGPGMAADPASVRALEKLAQLLTEPGLPLQSQLVANGPFQDLHVTVQSARGASVVEFVGTIDPVQAVAGVRALLWSLNNLTSFLLVDAKQLQGSNRLAELRRTLLTERTAVLAPVLADQWSTGQPVGRFWDGEPVSEAELRSTAQAFLVGKPMVVGLVGPPQMIEEVQAAFAPGGTR